MDELLDASFIIQVALPAASRSTGPRPPDFRHPLAYYALVHEVAALTDFGRLPLMPWLMARRGRIVQILEAGARLAMKAGKIDLLAELLLCNQMLGVPLSGTLQDCVGFLVENQLADGSWGEQRTPRANRRRHAVQTATAALLAYRATAPGP